MTKAGDQDESETATGTRERLIEAANTLIAEGGWAAVTTRAVAERAGVNKGLVHYHFASVVALCREATATALQRAMAPADEAIAHPDLANALRALAAAIEATDWDGVEARVLVEATVQAARDAELAALFRATLRGYQEQLTAMMGPRGEGGALAIALAAMLDGLSLYRILDPALDVRGAVDAVLDHLALDEDASRRPQ